MIRLGIMRQKFAVYVAKWSKYECIKSKLKEIGGINWSMTAKMKTELIFLKRKVKEKLIGRNRK